MTLNAAKKAATVYQARLELYQRLNIDQRKRLQSALKDRTEAKAKAKPPVLSKSTTKKPRKTKASTRDTGQPKVRAKRLPTARPPASQDTITIKNGKVELWVNQPRLKDRDKTFKEKKERNREYAVIVDGKRVVLNRQDKTYEFQGELVRGVPSLSPKLREMSNERVMDDLAKYASYVEAKSVNPPAPEWKPTLHGSIDKSLMTTDQGKKIPYGQMQIHHVDQWSNKQFSDVTKDYEGGLITLDEAKSQMRELLNPIEKTNRKGETIKGYEIKIQAQSERQLVVLAGGTHDFTNRKLYEANHPLGIHPDTGKLTEFGIPKTGEGGREPWFSNFRNSFWREVYRKESNVLTNELNRRLSNGDITELEVKSLWEKSLEKVDKTYKTMLDLRNKDQVNSPSKP
jgi:hypothetical protein